MFRAMSLGCLPRAQAACQKEVVAPSPKCMSRTREWHDGGGPGCGAHPPGFDSPREHRVSHWGFIPPYLFPAGPGLLAWRHNGTTMYPSSTRLCAALEVCMCGVSVLC